MDVRLAERTPPGTCPLCRSAVPLPPEPRMSGDVMAVLGSHFGKACPATEFLPPPALQQG